MKRKLEKINESALTNENKDVFNTLSIIYGGAFCESS